jgi:hypothetical protein
MADHAHDPIIAELLETRDSGQRREWIDAGVSLDLFDLD